MAGGWRNPVMQDEVAFIVLEGVSVAPLTNITPPCLPDTEGYVRMILIAAIAFDLAHPGYFFPPMRSGHRIISADHDQMVDLDERPSTTVA